MSKTGWGHGYISLGSALADFHSTTKVCDGWHNA